MGRKIFTTILITAGVIYLINAIPQLRHIIKKETTIINGRVIKDPRAEYVSP